MWHIFMVVQAELKVGKLNNYWCQKTELNHNQEINNGRIIQEHI